MYFGNSQKCICSSLERLLPDEDVLIKTGSELVQSIAKISCFSLGAAYSAGCFIIIVLLEMRRKQRMIPEWTKPKRLDGFCQNYWTFVFDKGDHKTCKKNGRLLLEIYAPSINYQQQY